MLPAERKNMMKIIKKNNTSLKIQTHAKHFIFQKAGYILSKKEYNAELERKKTKYRRKLYKSSYAYEIEYTGKESAGCYLIFESDKEKPSYIGKTTDINLRFRNHLCANHFENATKNGRRLEIFFCPASKEFSAGQIEALMIGYLWHKDLWNRF